MIKNRNKKSTIFFFFSSQSSLRLTFAILTHPALAMMTFPRNQSKNIERESGEEEKDAITIMNQWDRRANKKSKLTEPQRVYFLYKHQTRSCHIPLLHFIFVPYTFDLSHFWPCCSNRLYLRLRLSQPPKDSSRQSCLKTYRRDHRDSFEPRPLIINFVEKSFFFPRNCNFFIFCKEFFILL